MQIQRPLRILLLAAATVTFAFAGMGDAAAQEGDGSTSTTQLDLGGDPDGAPAGTPESSATTQLDVAGATDTREPPTRIDAGGGGTASDTTIPLPGVALAGGLVILTGAAALKMRREFQA